MYIQFYNVTSYPIIHYTILDYSMLFLYYYIIAYLSSRHCFPLQLRIGRSRRGPESRPEPKQKKAGIHDILKLLRRRFKAWGLKSIRRDCDG